jgi:phosphoglycerol transferase MdoB-like AlkP superfamily enzyme
MDDISITEKYKQQYAHFGRLKDILYRLPVLFSTVIGGLWYFAYSALNQNKFISIVVLLFTIVLCVVFYFIMERFRSAFNGYIDNLNKMDGDMRITIKGTGKSIMSLVQYSLWAAVFGSIVIILYAACGGIEISC